MNLYDLLHYRTECLIHKLPLHPYCITDQSVERREDVLKLHQNGLSLCSHHRQDLYSKPSLTGLNFRYDGSFNVNDACPKWVVANTITVHMMCEVCRERPIIKPRSMGFTTLMQLQENQYFYTFELIGYEKHGTYRGQLEHEILKHNRDGRFYHVDAYIQTGHAACRIGTCEGTDSLDKMLKGFINLNVPSLSKMESLDQIVEKMKLYTLFS